MSDRFEGWARLEISRLRAEADALESTLSRFLASHSAADRSSQPKTATALHSLSPRKRRSKNDVILSAIDQAGPDGMSMDEIVEAAERAGIVSTRNTLRSFCWNEKQHGRLIQPDVGRFASSSVVKNGAAGPTLKDGPAASETPNDAEGRGEVAHDNIAN